MSDNHNDNNIPLSDGIEDTAPAAHQTINGRVRRKKPLSRFVAFMDSLARWWTVILTCASVVLAMTAWKLYHVPLTAPLIKMKIELEKMQEENTKMQEEGTERIRQAEFKAKMTQFHVKLGSEFLDSGECGDAKAEFEKALDLDKTNKNAEYGKLKCELWETLSSKDYDPRILQPRLRRLVEEFPPDPHISMIMGDLAYSWGLWDRALTFYQGASDKGVPFPYATAQMGWIYYRQGNLAEAVKKYEAAVARAGWNQGFRNNLGYLYTLSGRYQDAANNYETVLQMDRRFLVTYNELALCSLLNGNTDKACSTLSDLVWFIDKNKDVLTLRRNSPAWYFNIYSDDNKPTGTIPLNNDSMKKCYAYYNMAVALYIKGPEHEAKANDYIQKGNQEVAGLSVDERQALKTLVESDLARITLKRPDWKAKIEKFRLALVPKQQARQGPEDVLSQDLQPNAH